MIKSLPGLQASGPQYRLQDEFRDLPGFQDEFVTLRIQKSMFLHDSLVRSFGFSSLESSKFSLESAELMEFLVPSSAASLEDPQVESMKF